LMYHVVILLPLLNKKRLSFCKLNTGIVRWPGKQIHSHNYRTPKS
jgi:hypothetical protein